MTRSKQMSESIELGIVLAGAGGFMDAYSYVCRGHVFANAQTGNMLLLGICVSQGSWWDAMRYLLPVISFATGIFLAELVRFLIKDKSLFHWRQMAVMIEAVILMGVCFIPQHLNLLANSLTSLACGIQVQSFRKIHGNGIATTMCIGNLRSATQHIFEFLYKKSGKAARKGLLYYGIILCFISGAVVGNVCVSLYREKALMICSGFLLVAFTMMFIDKEERLRAAAEE